jgi:hypothetical protein
MTYNGQAVTGQTSFYPSGNQVTTDTIYWKVTSSGVQFIAEVTNLGIISTAGNYSLLPQNMSPGQTVVDPDNTRHTLVGFEEIRLAGKTFSNTCHIRETDNLGNLTDGWFAPGYGVIKQVDSSGATTQYNGDL